jgi:hypothetical protein
MEAVQTQVSYPRGLDFEQVWAAMMENREQMKELRESQRESQKETDRLIKELRESQRETRESQKELRESQKATDRQMKETDRRMQETDKRMQETDKRLGKLGNRFGEVVEYMIAPNLCEKFTDFGLVFPKANSGTRVSDYVNNIHFEVDVMLENGDKALLVEVKTKLLTEHIKEHIKRLEKMRNYADLHGDKRMFLGAVAGVVVTANVKEYALKQGLFLIEPSGESFNITPPQGKPKEW